MKLSRKKAMDKMCKDCTYDELDAGTWTQQVEACGIESCSMWEYRPLSGATKQRLKEERIAQMSEEDLAVYTARAELARERLGR